MAEWGQASLCSLGWQMAECSSASLRVRGVGGLGPPEAVVRNPRAAERWRSEAERAQRSLRGRRMAECSSASRSHLSISTSMVMCTSSAWENTAVGRVRSGCVRDRVRARTARRPLFFTKSFTGVAATQFPAAAGREMEMRAMRRRNARMRSPPPPSPPPARREQISAAIFGHGGCGHREVPGRGAGREVVESPRRAWRWREERV